MAMTLIISFSQGNPHDKNKVKIDNGICFGLCIWLIETAKSLDNPEFLQYVSKFALKPGKIMETGLTYQKQSNQGRNDTITGLIFNIDIASGSENIGETMTSAYTLLDTAAIANSIYILSFFGKKWGHATVLLKKGGQCYWFDPNFGLYSIDPIDTVGELMGFLKKTYPDISKAKLNYLAITQ
ncbi:hypothetical protein [Chromobacterium sp. LK11]|uniref:hypothetical protein n=1 Tax=Chromobacterium sp. LK11 TaxID=1628212 RepID=UPI000A782CD9|nr:hypothetical protein [Chromobacterium sp. LK11]